MGAEVKIKKIFIVLGVIVILALGIIFTKTIFTGDSVEDIGGNVGLTLKVAIPCPGHAYLIENGLKNLQGVSSVDFRFPNYFDVRYDSTKISKQEILSLGIFKQYRATEVN